MLMLCSVGQENPRNLLSPHGTYHAHRSPSVVSVLSQMNLIHIHNVSLRTRAINIFLLSTTRSSNLVSSRQTSESKFCMYFLLLAHLILPDWIDMIILISLGEGLKLWGSSLFNFFQVPATSFLLIRYSPQHPVLKRSQSVFFLDMKDQVLHSCKVRVVGRNPELLCFLYDIYILIHWVNIISIDQWLMRVIQFRHVFVFLGLLRPYSKVKF